jgi:hypothetical protein
MPAQRTVPPAPTADARLKAMALAAVALAAIAAAYLAGKRAGAVHELMAASPAEARRIAFVRKQPCGPGWCEALWLGTTREDAVQVAVLAPGAEHCEEIAWAKDGYRVGFVVNGYQLRIFDAENKKEVRRVNLIEPDGTPSSRFIRGVTFSQTGAAVTFDDCPRGRSGCKSGLAAVR